MIVSENYRALVSEDCAVGFLRFEAGHNRSNSQSRNAVAPAGDLEGPLASALRLGNHGGQLHVVVQGCEDEQVATAATAAI